MAKTEAERKYQREWVRRWRAANPAKVREANAKYKRRQTDWRRKNADRLRASSAAAYAADPARAKARVAAWNAANPERRKQIAMRYAELNRAQKRTTGAAYRRANPCVSTISAALRRARKLALTPVLTDMERADVAAIYAKARALTELTGTPHHVDHVKPLAKGGLHHPNNLQVLTAAENMKKGAR